MQWIYDSAATRHICANKTLFHEFEENIEENIVYMGNSVAARVSGKGKVFLKFTYGKTLAFSDVLYVPDMHRNLVSGALLNKAGLKLVLESSMVVITKNGDIVGKGYLSRNNLFILNTDEINNNVSSSAYIVESVDLSHNRLGHMNVASLKRLRNMNLLPSVKIDSMSKCRACVEAKYTKLPFKVVNARQTDLLGLIHSDLTNFKNIVSKGGKRYYITFIDDYSRYTKVYLLRSKDEAEIMFIKYKAEVENSLNRKIKRLRSDRSGEYMTNSLKEFC